MTDDNTNNFPDHQKAAKMALYHKICAVVGFVLLMGVVTVGVLY